MDTASKLAHVVPHWIEHNDSHVEQLAEWGLLFQEEDRFLSLVLPREPAWMRARRSPELGRARESEPGGEALTPVSRESRRVRRSSIKTDAGAPGREPRNPD